MEDIHPDLFHGVPEATFHRAADELIDAIPDLDDDEMLVGVMHLVAMISAHGGDGHMGVWPPDNPDAVRRFPVRLWEFPDGVHVTAARAPNDDLEGARVLKVDGIPIDEVFERLDPVVPRDTPSNLRAARMVFLTSAEVLTGLGIADDDDTMTLDVETADGERRSATVEAVDAATYADWVGGWELLLPERPGLDFLRTRRRRSASSTSRTSGRSTSVTRSCWNTAAASSARSARRCAITTSSASCLDRRNNGGGEAGGFRRAPRVPGGPTRPARGVGRPADVLRGLDAGAAPRAARAGRGLHRETMGGAPSFWADPDTVTLPYSGLVALVDSRFNRSPVPGDTRLEVPPDIAVPFTSADYFAGRDPVLERALS